MAATLKNKSRQPVVLVLDHPAFADPANGWKRTTAKFGVTQEDGSRVVSEVRRAYPGTITLMPGESVTDLHPAIQSCSQVPHLVKTGVLTVTETPDAPEVVEVHSPRVVTKKQAAAQTEKE